MTDLFIVLASVTVVCAGAALPCFFKSSRNTVGCLIMSAAVLAATAACFVTPVRECFASFSRFDAVFFSVLFVASFVISLFYRLLLGVAAVLYVLWSALFLIILLSAGFSPSSSVGEITTLSSADRICPLEQITMSPYHLLPFKRVWYRVSQHEVPEFPTESAIPYLEKVGAVYSVKNIQLPDSSTYPHIYFLSISADGSPVFETVF